MRGEFPASPRCRRRDTQKVSTAFDGRAKNSSRGPLGTVGRAGAGCPRGWRPSTGCQMYKYVEDGSKPERGTANAVSLMHATSSRVPGRNCHELPTVPPHTEAGKRPGQRNPNSAVNYQKREGCASQGTARRAQGQTQQPVSRGTKFTAGPPPPHSPGDCRPIFPCTSITRHLPRARHRAKHFPCVNSVPLTAPQGSLIRWSPARPLQHVTQRPAPPLAGWPGPVYSSAE